MMDNIQIINKSGDGMITEGLSYFEIPSTGKKYLIYTLNEKVDNDLTKIYVAENNEQIGGANPINETEWDDLRKKMLKISHKETVEDVKFLKTNNNAFYVGDPKKLAITAIAKESFKDVWKINTMPDDQSDSSTNNGSTGSFFNTEVVGGNEENVVQPVQPQSIFANPTQPIIETISTQPTVEQSTVTPQAVEPQTNILTPIIAQNNVSNTMAVSQDKAVINNSVLPSESPIVNNNENIQHTNTPVDAASPINQVPVISESVIESSNTMQYEAPALEQIIEQPVVETPQNINSVPIEPANDVNPSVIPTTENKIENINQSSKLITDEEALEAINLIQEYITQEENKNA